MTRAQWACSEAESSLQYCEAPRARLVMRRSTSVPKRKHNNKRRVSWGEKKKWHDLPMCPFFPLSFFLWRAALLERRVCHLEKNGELMLDPVYNNATPPQMCWGYCNSLDSNWEYSVNPRKRYCCKSFRFGVIASLAQLLFVLALMKSVIISIALLFHTDSR